MIAERIPEIAKLTREERFQLACELWEEEWGAPSEEFHPNPEMDGAIGKLLKKRSEEYEANPNAAIIWGDFRKKWCLPE